MTKLDAVEASNPLKVPLPDGIELGMEVRVKGQTGTFRVAGTYLDSSITCFSTTKSGGARSFMPDKVRPAKPGDKRRKKRVDKQEDIEDDDDI